MAKKKIAWNYKREFAEDIATIAIPTAVGGAVGATTGSPALAFAGGMAGYSLGGTGWILRRKEKIFKPSKKKK